MSARLFKKYLKEQELLQPQKDPHLKDENDGDEEEEEEEQLNSGSSINPFDLLNDDDHVSDQDDELETSEEILVRADEKQDPPELKGTGNSVSRSSNKSKKKKKKKNKEGSSESTHKDEKPLDAILEALSLDVNTSGKLHAPEKAKAVNTRLRDSLAKPPTASVLQVDPKYLNAENELRRIFGSKVVKSFEKSNQTGTGSSRQVRGGRRGGYIPRKTVLVTASEHWPRWDGSFSMEFLEVKEGYHYFRYVHSSSYAQAQSAFEAAKAIHDLNGIASILLYNPYHLDSLLTMADYFKFAGEQQMSAESISKCLYALECAWHPLFTPCQDNCQVKFNDEKNRPLFTTLFAHMKNMDKRGCHRSALEVCKFLLSLDSDDPMGAKFYIDYLSLRAEEYAWLERFSEDYQSDNSLWLFPNFSYSLAVCRFYLEKQESEEGTHALTAKSSSTDLMKQALMLHPSVLKKLIEKVPLKDQAWAVIVKDALFRAEEVGIPSLDHLIKIYVETNYLIWRLPDLQKLLRDAAQQVVETLKRDSSEAKDWACVRKEAFSSEKNEYRHLLVSDFSHSTPTLPPENLQPFMVDPRMMEGMHNEGHAANAIEGLHAPPRNVANRNALAVLFESMLPWVHYGDVNGAGEDGDNQMNGHGQGNEEH